MEQENRETTVKWLSRYCPCALEGLEDWIDAWDCVDNKHCLELYTDHRLAAVAREALEKIVDRESMPAFQYSVKWGELPMRPEEQARAALRSLTEGGQAAGEEKKGTGE